MNIPVLLIAIANGLASYLIPYGLYKNDSINGYTAIGLWLFILIVGSSLIKMAY